MSNRAIASAMRIANDTAQGDARVHTGAIHSVVPGRTDRLPVQVLSGSYVVPADIVSGLGEGNTLAGTKILDRMFGHESPYSIKMLSRRRGGPAMPKPSPTPVIVAGGEYVIDPHVVAAIGNGDMNKGHDILDQFVKTQRKKLLKTLRKLPGPARD